MHYLTIKEYFRSPYYTMFHILREDRTEYGKITISGFVSSKEAICFIETPKGTFILTPNVRKTDDINEIIGKCPYILQNQERDILGVLSVFGNGILSRPSYQFQFPQFLPMTLALTDYADGFKRSHEYHIHVSKNNPYPLYMRVDRDSVPIVEIQQENAKRHEYIVFCEDETDFDIFAPLVFSFFSYVFLNLHWRSYYKAKDYKKLVAMDRIPSKRMQNLKKSFTFS